MNAARQPSYALLVALVALATGLGAGCASDGAERDGPDGPDGSALPDLSDASDVSDSAHSDDIDAAGGSDASDAATDPEVTEGPRFTVVTFNTGTGPEGIREREGEAYGPDEAAITDEYYGNGLNWPPLVREVRAFFDGVDADVVVFQELFWNGDCAGIPEEAQRGFVCEGWEPGEPTVVESVLGPGWQIACHPGKPDKCAAVRERFGRFRGCDGALCVEGLEGYPVEGCGSGARVARGTIDRVDGGTLTVVSVHGTSGFDAADVDCRLGQIDQVFVDLGDGEPGANGEVNLIVGDFNTDPGRMASGDASAARWSEWVGEGRRFHFVSEVGRQATPTYAGFFNIDHVVSDVLEGSCWTAGYSEGRPAVSEMVYLDHAPVVCVLGD